MSCSAVPSSFPQGAKPGKCLVDWAGMPPIDQEWNSTFWSSYKPKLIRDPSTGEFSLEINAPLRFVTTKGNYITGLAKFASTGESSYVKFQTVPQHTMLTAQADTSDICAPFAARVCCWSATAYNQPGTCEETRQLSYNSSGTTCISCKTGDYGDIGGSLFTAIEVAIKDGPYFGKKDRLIPGTSRPEAVYASAVITEFPGSEGLLHPRIRFEYDTRLIAQSCSAAKDWNNMLSSLSDGDLGEHIAWDTHVMKTLCERTWIPDGKKDETVNWLECPSCQAWADSLKYEDGETSGSCSANPLSGDCPAKYADLQMQDWCLSRPSNPACKCVLRSQQKDWQVFAELDRSNDGCWYRPCAGGMSQSGVLVEHDLRHAKDVPQLCPDICQSIIEFEDSGHATLNDVTQTTICNGGSGGDGGLDKWLLYGLAGVVGVALLAGSSYALYRALKQKQ